MKTVFNLTFIGFKNLFSSFQTKRNNKNSGRSMIIIYLFLAIYMLVLSCSFSIMMYHQLSGLGMQQFVPVMFVLAAFMLIFVLGIFNTSGYLFGSKDIQALAALPISTNKVFLSKFLMAYIFDLVFSLLLMAPAGYIYLFNEGFNILSFLLFTISVFLLPMLPLCICSVLSYAVGLLLKKTKFKGLISFIFFLLFFVGFMYISQNLNTLINYVQESEGSVIDSITRIFPPAKWTLGVLDGEILPFIYLLLINFVPMGILYYVVPKRYMSIVAGFNQSTIKSDYVYTRQNKSSAYLSCLKKEIKLLFSNMNYAMNSFAGILICAMFLFMLLSGTLQSEMMEFLNNSIVMLVISLMLTFSCGIASTTSSAISAEGKSFWIYKSSPVSEKTIFKAKLSVNLIFQFPIIVIFGVIFSVLLGLGFVETVITLLLPLLYVLMLTLYGMIINLSKPNLNWTNMSQVVKNSASAMILTFSSMGFAIILIGSAIALYALLSLSSTVILLVLSLLMLALVILFARILFNWGIRKFKEIY